MDTQWWHVIVFLTTNVVLIVPTGAESSKGQACEWIICNRMRTPSDESFSCSNTSYIFVENVTDFWGANSELAYQNVRQMCMGARSCDPSRICRGLRTTSELLRVRYVCVNVSTQSDSKQCEWPVATIWRREGHIRSPNYPAPFPSQSCSWRISAPEDRFVHISVHDVSFEFVSRFCLEGLNITYQECHTGHVVYNMYCGNYDIDSEIIACGSVSVQLVTDRRYNGVRFWLSFEVTSSPEAAVRPPLERFVDKCTRGEQTVSRILSSHVLHRPVLRPLDPTIVMVTSTFPSVLQSTTLPGVVTSIQPTNEDKGPPGDKGLSTTVIIIVVSTIGAVLVMAIILAVIFLKRPKVERVEHVYAVPTPRETSPVSPNNSGSPLKHERPILKDCYCAVADAIPSQRLHITPASPGYAEVEDVCKGDNCRWDPHTFTFTPTFVIRPTPPSDLPFSKTSPHISSFSKTSTHGKIPGSAPTHNRTYSDSSHLFTESPYLNRSSRTTRSFRDPKTTDYENIIIDEKNKSPCFVQSDQKYLLQSRLGRVTAAAAKNPSEGVKCIQVSPPTVPLTEALYANTDIANRGGSKKSYNPPGSPLCSSLTGCASINGSGHKTGNRTVVNNPELYTHINKQLEARNSDNQGIGTRIPVNKGHQKQRSRGDNSVTGEPPLYENQSIVRL